LKRSPAFLAITGELEKHGVAWSCESKGGNRHPKIIFEAGGRTVRYPYSENSREGARTRQELRGGDPAHPCGRGVMSKLFTKEVELCSAFITALPKNWLAYPETAGYDIVLVRTEDGAQVGIEAKLSLNTKVICQAIENSRYESYGRAGPDFEAVLVPSDGVQVGLGTICAALSITVLTVRDARPAFSRRPHPQYVISPMMPEAGETWYGSQQYWLDRCPAQRLPLPDYVPDVMAGRSGPTMLTDWKIRAIKVDILLRRNGVVTRGDFERLKLSPRRWIDMGWLITTARGIYAQGPRPMGLQEQHPVNYAQIEADFDKWAPKA
jgi:hypothetical protein